MNDVALTYKEGIQLERILNRYTSIASFEIEECSSEEGAAFIHYKHRRGRSPQPQMLEVIIAEYYSRFQQFITREQLQPIVKAMIEAGEAFVPVVVLEEARNDNQSAAGSNPQESGDPGSASDRAEGSDGEPIIF